MVELEPATQAIAAAKSPLNPVELKAALKKAGHPSKSDSALCTQVFPATMKDPAAGYAQKA